MKNFLNKFISIVILSVILFTSTPTGFVLAYYNDSEKSQGYLETGLLDFSLQSDSDFSPTVGPSQAAKRIIDVKNDGTLPFKYWLSATGTIGDLCPNITIIVTKNALTLYQGPLMSMPEIDLGIYDKNNSKLEFLATIPPNDTLQNKSCAFDFVYKGVQTNHDMGQGYYDIETISNVINAGSWKNSKCNLSEWNPGSIKVEVTNSYDSDCRVESFNFIVNCQSGNNIDCDSIGLNFGHGLGVNAMDQITPPYPEGATTMFSSGPLKGLEGVRWIQKPMLSSSKTYSVNVTHPLQNYNGSYGAYLTYGQTCDGGIGTLTLNMPDYVSCVGKTTVTNLAFSNPNAPEAKDYVVLNEFLPNPEGQDDYGNDWGYDGDLKPKGEWVELYNNNASAEFDLYGWILKDKQGNAVVIDSSNTNNGSTIIGKKGTGQEWMVIYVNLSGQGKPFLDNSQDTIYLYDNNGILISQYTYNGSEDYCKLEPTLDSINNEIPIECPNNGIGPVPPNKSYANIPDGSGIWYDPIPTPGTQNISDSTNTEPINSTTTVPIIDNTTTTVSTSSATTSEIIATTTIPEIIAPTSSSIITTSTTSTVSTTTLDIIAPIITLNGEAIIEIPINTLFVDPGATAFDETDGDISFKIIVVGDVNTSIIGEYIISYEVFDNAGNKSETKYRTVIIKDQVPTAPESNPLSDSGLQNPNIDLVTPASIPEPTQTPQPVVQNPDPDLSPVPENDIIMNSNSI